MRVILIDDELLALQDLEYQLLEVAHVDVAGKFTDPHEGKRKILHDEVDVVFLDIHLPEMDGIELAEQLLEYKPKLHIVFVTAYNDYAIKAFELNALDYILKPVGIERLTNTVQRIRERLGHSPRSLPVDKQGVFIKLFQQISIGFGDGPAEPLHWRTSRTLEMFLYLLQYRGRPVLKSELTELLWPDFEPDKAYAQLYATVYQVRKTLEPFSDEIKILNARNSYTLVMEKVRLDVAEWEEALHFAPALSVDTLDVYERVMSRYEGDYLQELDQWWVEAERHRLRLLWLRISMKMAECYRSSGMLDEAMEWYLDICRYHPQVEEAHLGLMQIFDMLHNHPAVHRQFRLLEDILKEELNVPPSPHVRQWYDQWKRRNAQESGSARSN